MEIDEIEHLTKALNRENYFDVKYMNGRFYALQQQVYTVGLFVGLDLHGYEHRYCYETLLEAKTAIASWDGCGLAPGPWVKLKGTFRGQFADWNRMQAEIRVMHTLMELEPEAVVRLWDEQRRDWEALWLNCDEKFSGKDMMELREKALYLMEIAERASQIGAGLSEAEQERTKYEERIDELRYEADALEERARDAEEEVRRLENNIESQVESRMMEKTREHVQEMGFMNAKVSEVKSQAEVAIRDSEETARQALNLMHEARQELEGFKKLIQPHRRVRMMKVKN